MSKVSFIYFDVGGVVIKDFSDSNKWAEMLTVMGITQGDIPEFDKLYNEFEVKVCLGQNHVDELMPIFRKKFNLKVGQNFSMFEYFLDHFEKNIELWPIVKMIAKKVKVGLLTDQYPGLLAEINKRGLLPPVTWDQVIDSSAVGLKKPMPEIYELAEKHTGVPGKEILFIDNRQQNLVPARERGWHTFRYDSSDYHQANLALSKFVKKIM